MPDTAGAENLRHSELPKRHPYRYTRLTRFYLDTSNTKQFLESPRYPTLPFKENII